MKKTLLMVVLLFATIFTYSQNDTTTWHGNFNSSWDKPTNWTNGVPDDTMNVTIDTKIYQPAITSDAECLNLIIEESSILQIGLVPGLTSHLKIYGNLDIYADSGLTVREKNFVTVFGDTYIYGKQSIKLLSYKHGVGIQQRIFSGSFLNYGEIIYGDTGTVEAEVYMVNGSDSGYRYYHQIGPITTKPSFGANYGQKGVYLQDFNIRPYGTYAYMYDETINTSLYNPWINIWHIHVPVVTTSGILLSTEDGIDYPLKMVGEYFYGDITINPSTGIYFLQPAHPPQQPYPLPLTVGRYTAGGSNINLISNPYPSSVNWDTLFNLNSTDVKSKIYIWNPKFQNYGVYVAYESGTLDVTQNIALGQAFFVETINPTFTFYDTARCHSIDPFVKDETLYSLKIRIIGNELGDECVINFNENATGEYDEEYDSYKWESYNANSPEIKINENTPIGSTPIGLTINSIPFFTIPSPDPPPISVNLFTECNSNGDYYLETTGAESFEGYNVTLEDIETSTIIDLKFNDTYNFTSGIVPFENRFVIHFDINTYINENNSTNNINVYSYDKNIYIQGEVDNVIVTNILGQTVYEGNKTQITIESSGTYIVRTIKNNSQTIHKVQIL